MDMLFCFVKYKMWSNQYVNEKMYSLSKIDRKTVGSKIYEYGLRRDMWQKDFQLNRKFLIKYSNIKYEKANLRDVRNKAYAKRFNAGKNFMVEYNVNISRQHYLNGNIQIGDNVLISKNVFIDYSGEISIRNNVIITNGVIIESHHHPNHSDFNQDEKLVTPTKLLIEEGVVIGSRAIILSSCNYIGKYARIGAGAVVTHNVADYSIVAGVPAKIIKSQSNTN